MLVDEYTFLFLKLITKLQAANSDTWVMVLDVYPEIYRLRVSLVIVIGRNSYVVIGKFFYSYK